MSFTKDEMDIIREKLGGVDTPSVDEAWKRMEEMMESPPSQAGTTPRMGLKYYVVLNSIVGALIVASSILYFGISNANQRTHRAEFTTHEIEKSSEMVNALYTLNTDHSEDLMIPELVIITENQLTGSTQTALPSVASIAIERANMSVDEFASEETKSLLKKSGTEKVEPMIPFGTDGLLDLAFQSDDFQHRDRWENQEKFKLNLWGVRAGFQFLPRNSSNTLLSNFSGGVFWRHYVDPNQALQFELDYNPISIADVSYTQQQNASSQRDSLVISQLRYLSLPILYQRSFDDRVQIQFGVQLSKLIQLHGTHYTYDASGSNKDAVQMERTSIVNDKLIKRFNAELVVDLSYQLRERWDAGFRMQLSPMNISGANLISSTRPTSFQVRTSVILNKKK